MNPLTEHHIAVLMGGPGSEREVSLASGAGVVTALRELDARVSEVDVRGADFTLPEGTTLAFNILHGTFGEDGQVQRLLDERGIPYTGEGVAGSELAFDKIASKRRFEELGIATPEFEVIEAGEQPAMPMPYVVKAPREGSSVGVFIVKEAGEVAGALEGAAKYAGRLLIEKFVRGRELTVGVLGAQALPVIEIAPHEGFYDFRNKYPFLGGGGGANHICPARLTGEETQRVQEMALAAHRALGLEVYSRVDLILPENGLPSVLEINTIPGMTPCSLLPEAAAAAGVSYAGLCSRIIELSLAKPR